MKTSYFTIKGKRYALVKVEDLSFEEAIEVKRLAGGVNPLLVPELFRALDPEALLAMFSVSMRRVDPQLGPETLAGENLIDAANTIDNVDDERPDAGPPTEETAPS